MEIEEPDRRLLRALQQDGRMTNQQLAEKVAMSTSACWRRVRALEDAGVIEGYSARVNAAKTGLSFHAIAHVQIARHDSSHANNFTNEIVRRPEVLDCFAMTGSADFHLRIRCRDIDAYNEFLEGFLVRLPGVANVRTNLVLREIKHETNLGL